MVAMGTNIDMTLLSKIERGERCPTTTQIERIAEYFGLDKKELEVATTASRILSEYGYNEITFAAATSVQEEIRKYSLSGMDKESS